MQRYFVDKIENDVVYLTKEQEHHIVKVMRMKEQEQVTCACDGIIYLCEIESLNPLKVVCKERLDENNELEVDVTLLYCLPKGDKLDLVLQKATELGVKEIILVQSERCIAKIKKEDEARKLIRFNTIVKEASEQSKRSVVPIVNKIINYKDINKYHFDHSFIAYENEKDETYFSYLSKVNKKESIGILIGSEGGFSLKEVEYAKSNGYTSISLGKRILRSETAVFYALSAISLIIEG
jgi:16S rRNA (uracil1498-N3)-methyltransferase